MKKYLIKGLLALVVGGFTASCADKDGDYVPVGQQKAAAYADAFKELIGGEVAPNHDWGFTKTSLVDETAETRAVTRTAYTNSNMWESDGLSVPAAITPREKEVVMNWFRTNENPRSETINIHNYFIQNVDYTDHTYNAYYQKDGRTETVTITNPGRSNMDYIFVGPGADEIVIILSGVSGIAKVCLQIGGIIVCVHQSKYSVCDSSSCCRCSSRCCRYSASCSMSGVLSSFFIALSIRKCIDDVDTLLIAVHHDFNLLAADGGQSLIDVLCTVLRVRHLLHSDTIALLDLSFEAQCLGITTTGIGDSYHAQTFTIADKHVVDNYRCISI